MGFLIPLDLLNSGSGDGLGEVAGALEFYLNSVIARMSILKFFMGFGDSSGHLRQNIPKKPPGLKQVSTFYARERRAVCSPYLS